MNYLIFKLNYLNVEKIHNLFFSGLQLSKKKKLKGEGSNIFSGTK